MACYIIVTEVIKKSIDISISKGEPTQCRVKCKCAIVTRQQSCQLFVNCESIGRNCLFVVKKKDKINFC